MVTRQRRSIRIHLLFHTQYFTDTLRSSETAQILFINNSSMMLFRILFCHVLLFGIALSSPVETKGADKKSITDATTHTPLKAKNINNEQVQSLNNAQTEKSVTKKRNVPDILSGKSDYFDDDAYEGRGAAAADYDGNQALRAYLESPRNENSFADSGKYRANDYHYLDEDSRQKRTAGFDGIFGRPESYGEPEVRLSPEDLMILAAYKQQQRLYNNFPYGRWTDINNSIDDPDTEMETEEIYERPENFFDRYYDQRYQNWANLPRSNKFVMNRQRRSFSGYPKLRVPVYKRAIL